MRILVDGQSCFNGEALYNVAVSLKRVRFVRVKTTLHPQKSQLRVWVMQEVSEVGEDDFILRAVVQEHSKVDDLKTFSSEFFSSNELWLPLGIVSANVKFSEKKAHRPGSVWVAKSILKPNVEILDVDLDVVDDLGE